MARIAGVSEARMTAYRGLAEYRRRGAVVALGGPHVLSCPEEAAPHADALAGH